MNYCVECQWHGFYRLEHSCHHPKLKTECPVQGPTPMACIIARQLPSCGPDGLLFVKDASKGILKDRDS